MYNVVRLTTTTYHMKIVMQPLGDRVLVKPIEDEIATKSGIIIVASDVNKELPQCGEVLALGVGGTFQDCPNPSSFLKVGDIVYFNKYAGIDYELTAEAGQKPVAVKMLRLDAVEGVKK